MTKPITQRQYALRRGVSPQAISQLVRAGVIPLTADNRIDPETADRVLASRKSRFKSADSELLLAARAQFETARARREEIRLAREARSVVSIATAAQRMERDYGIVRARLLGLPAKCAQRFAAARTPGAAAGVIKAEVYEILRELAEPRAAIATVVEEGATR